MPAQTTATTTTTKETTTETRRVKSLTPRSGKQLSSLEEAVVRMHHGVSVRAEAELSSNAVTDELANAGRLSAPALVRELAKDIQGGGGGQPFFATAGGKNAAGLGTAIAKAEELVARVTA